MALVSSMQVHLQQHQMEVVNATNRMRSFSSGASSSSGGGGGGRGSLREIVEEEDPAVIPSSAGGAADILQRVSAMEMVEEEEKVYVAVGKEFKESKLNLIWALQITSREAKMALVHVHRPSQMIPMMGGKFPASQLTPQQVKAHRQVEREKMNKILDEYLGICGSAKVQAEKLVIEMDDVAKGLIELIAQHGITKLIMGAAADRHFSKKMKGPRSKTAITVQKEAVPSCKIWFVCKGNLICTREASLHGYGILQSPMGSPSVRSTQSEPLKNSFSLGPQLTNPEAIFRHRSRSDNYDSHGREITLAFFQEAPMKLAPQSRLNIQGSTIDVWEGISRSSHSSDPSSWSASDELSNLGSISMPKDDGSEEESVVLPSTHESKEDFQFSSPHEEQEGGEIENNFYVRLQQALTEAENSRHEAYEESCRRQKAERDALEAIRKAKAAENLYTREMKQRKGIEEELQSEKLELEKLKCQQDKVIEELKKANEQKLALEIQISDSDHLVKDFIEKLSATQLLLNSLQREREELQRGRDDAIREAEELQRRKEEELNTSTYRAPGFLEFSFQELVQATHEFDSSLEIGEGGYGKVYKGYLRHTTVAIKRLHPHSIQGQTEFQQEVDVLSKVRHPNLITLIGACPEAWSLIYEFVPNGSLEDRLLCKDNSAPLPWEVRIRIAAEICSVLIFLHSNKPHSVVHGDLKPANILLDANFVSKLSDFGISRLLIQSSYTTTLCHRTDPKGTFVYMDPEFLSTGELTPRSDTYSFGIIILRLLTRRPALGIVKEVQEALEKGNLHMVLDELAGDWPFVQAKQLAHLGLWCCEMNRKNRPDLEEVWRVLEPMKKASLGSSLSFSSAAGDDSHAPSYFICPIFQEIMRDPHVAADGYTYEAEALKGWLYNGHETSPMTNLKLPHMNLIPNHALRSAIQEWQQQHQS